MGLISRSALRALVLLVLIGPVLLGIGQTLTAAFGWLPALGERSIDLAAWQALLERPGLATAVRLSAWTGSAATLIGFCLAFALVAGLYGRPLGRRLTALLAPSLATPHAAMAIGLAFVIAPSGWLFRLLAGPLDLAQPPAFALVSDPMGIGLIAGLLLKEIPFLALVMTAALSHLPVRRWLIMARSLGYGTAAAWVRVILPRLWPQIRLPTLIVFSYALSNVDMALLLGPANPPVLAVLVLRLYTAPELTSLMTAGAGALLQALLVVTGFVALWLLERMIRHVGIHALRRGRRGRIGGLIAGIARWAAGLLFGLGTLALAALVVWSFSWRWPWPDIWPERLSLAAWLQPSSGWVDPLLYSLGFATLTTVVALVLVIAWLETTSARFHPVLSGIVYAPLLLPQIGFLPGLQFGFLQIGLDAGILAVSWAHLLFVFPYVLLVLIGPWRGFDPSLLHQAASLGAGPLRRLVSVKLPVLLGPVLAAAAIGVAVSIAQYLPTLIMGAGRITTLTTEAVSLASGADRRITAVYAMLQTLIPLVAYAVAILLPAWQARNRRFLRE